MSNTASLRQTRSQLARIGDEMYTITSDDDYLDKVGTDFEPQMCSLFKTLVRRDDAVLDIGANIGCTSLLFAQIAGRVDAFEPSPSTFKYLETNTKNTRHSNIRLHNFGLGAIEARLTLTFSPADRSGGFVSNLTQVSAGHTTEEILIRKGDEVIDNRKIDFVKIDVEGFEKNVIEGLNVTIARCKPLVVLELNHWCLNAFQRTSIPDFFDFLLSVFPAVYAVDGEACASLSDPDQRYHVMYNHILHFRYPNLVAAFTGEQTRSFLSRYSK